MLGLCMRVELSDVAGTFLLRRGWVRGSPCLMLRCIVDMQCRLSQHFSGSLAAAVISSLLRASISSEKHVLLRTALLLAAERTMIRCLARSAHSTVAT